MMNNLSYYDRHHYLILQSMYYTIDPNLRSLLECILYDYRIETINFMRGKKAKTLDAEWLQNPNTECVILYMKTTSSGFDYYVQVEGVGIPQRISGRYLKLL